MRLSAALAALLLLAGCVLRPMPKTGPIPRAASAASYTNRVDVSIPWELPADAQSRCWTLQSSTNLVDWADVPSACLTGETLVRATNQFMFFRLKGN